MSSESLQVDDCDAPSIADPSSEASYISLPSTISSSTISSNNETDDIESNEDGSDISDNDGDMYSNDNQNNMNDEDNSNSETFGDRNPVGGTNHYTQQSITEYILRILKSKVARGWSREDALEQLLSFYNFSLDDEILYKNWDKVLDFLTKIGYKKPITRSALKLPPPTPT